jgi:hypothetical protein
MPDEAEQVLPPGGNARQELLKRQRLSHSRFPARLRTLQERGEL